MSQYDSQVTDTANQLGVPPSIALAVMNQESSGNPNAVSSAGAQGLFQLMPGTAAELGVSDPFNPQENITGGLTYLKQLFNQFGDWTSALIAYNEGPGNFSKGTVYPSSQSYADSILANAGDFTSGSPTDDFSAAVDTLGLPDVSGLSLAAWGAIAGAVALVLYLVFRD